MLALYNTMSRKKELFKPLNDGRVKMFTCGPSIYRRPHIGNYRTFLWEDVLQRYLEHLGNDVERVINFTDVEDKAISEAKEEGTSVWDLTNRTADGFLKDAELLKIELPEFIPRSSTSVDQAVELIKILIEKGHAYRYDGDIFFDPLKFEGFGKLFRLDMSRWPKNKKRFKRDTYPGRRWNLGDFILWHRYREGDLVFWETDIGKGRPAWNIQDPAMITQHLGYTIDIACGGVDNLYRHHDYNIAVIESVSGKQFSRYWLHAEHLLVDGKKMSKSVGNIIYPSDLIEEGHAPRHIRFYLIYGHHRKRLNLTREDMREKSRKLDEFRGMVQKVLQSSTGREESDESAPGLIENLRSDFAVHMNDDLDVKQAFDAAFKALSGLVRLKEKGQLSPGDSRAIRSAVEEMDRVLQVVFD